MRVLLAEDDAGLAQRLRQELQEAGYAVDVSADGKEAEYLGDERIHDAVILDLGLPGRPGLEVLSAWRGRRNDVPVIVLTARGAWHEKVDGFRAGADDYLAKPFHTEELIARLRAVISRRSGRSPGLLECAGLALDEDRQQVSVAGKEPVPLTGVEFRLLRYLMLNAGRVISKSELMEHVYDFDSDKDSNVLEVYVNRVRRKVGRERILTRRGQGYTLDPAQ